MDTEEILHHVSRVDDAICDFTEVVLVLGDDLAAGLDNDHAKEFVSEVYGLNLRWQNVKDELEIELRRG